MLLIRHAPTDTGGRLCGSFDVPLSPEGRAQVDAIRRGLARRTAADVLLTSTLRRATHVADALGRVWGLRPKPAEWAREIHCGAAEGMPLDQLQREFPDLWARNEAQVDDTFAWPGGETYTAFRSRILEGLESAAATFPGCRVAVVTHAGVISQVLGVARGRPACAWAPDRPHPLTATEIIWGNGAPGAILTYNDPHWYREARPHD